MPLAIALLLIGLALGWSLYAHGWESTRLDLLQYRTRDDLVAYGSHWHSHWLHLLFMLPAAAIVPLATITAQAISRSPSPHVEFRIRWSEWLPIVCWIGLFVGLTIVFHLDPETFTSPRYLGHQMREIVTHALVTIPLASAALLLRGRLRGRGTGFAAETVALEGGAGAVAARSEAGVGGAGVLGHAQVPARVKLGIATLCAAVIPGWIMFQLRGIDLLAVAAKQSSYLDLLASHFLEHALDYVLVSLLAVGMVELSRMVSPVRNERV